MPRRSKGPRLWLQPARRGKDGKLFERAVWVIRDGGLKRSTGFGPNEAEKAQTLLANYIIGRTTAPRNRDRDPAIVKIADVISIYSDDVVSRHARPHETAERLSAILDYFGEMTLSQVNRTTCEGYVEWRIAQPRRRSSSKKPITTDTPRRELEDFRAAIRHHWEEGLCAALTPVVLPEKGEGRERWLTRSEAARLLFAAWRLAQRWRDQPSERRIARHVARFILAGLYTGTRAGAICGAALRPTIGAGLIDVDNGIFYRRPPGKRETKKRQPPIRIPPRFLTHARRWVRLGLARRFLVEWNDRPVKRINKAFRSVRKVAGLGDDVVPHTLRHTAITWQAQLGVPPHEICGFFGITMEVFEKHYGHHHPDYQTNAVNALSRPRRPARGARAIGDAS
jgi:integrase